jgi:hypothetical protein
MPLPAPNRPRISEALGTNVTALGGTVALGEGSVLSTLSR